MSNLSFLVLIQNSALLLALAVVFDTTARHWQVREKTWKQVVLGFLLAAIGMMLLKIPLIYLDGFTLASTSVLLSVSGLFFGEIPTLIATLISALYCYSLGGSYITGILIIVAAGLLGILWRRLRKYPLAELTWWQLFIFGFAVHVVVLTMIFTQPIKIALPLVLKNILPILLIYPTVTTLLGLLLVNRLRREIAIEENKKSQNRLKSMVDILQNAEDSTQSIINFAMEEAVKLTESELGFIFYYSEDLKRFTLSSWSKRAIEVCKIPSNQTIYELSKTGIWGEPVRQRKPIIINNFQATNPLKKGYPEGHPQLNKLLEVPIFSDNQIVAVVGMANKDTDYNEVDITQLSLLMEMVWKNADRKKAIEDLRVSEENYRLLFNQAAEGIFITTRDGQYLDVNESGCSMLGYSREELSKSFKEVLKNNDENFNREKVIGDFNHKRKILSERKLKTKSGQVIDVEILTQILADGRVQKVVRNITDRKKAEEIVIQTQNELHSLLRISDDSRKALLSVIEDQKLVEEALRKSEKSYRNLFENITQGFALHKIILDKKGKPVDYQFLAANPAYEKLTGLLVEKILGKNVKTILPDLEQSWIDIYGSVALTGQPKRFENYSVSLGKFYDVTAFCPELGYFAVVISDISDRKKYEQEIQDFNQELEARVQQRTAELETANRELESFSYSISHDLRAPLRSINGFSQIILEEFSNQFDPSLSHYFDLIQKNATMMGNLVDDLLNFSRLGRQSLNVMTLNPKTLIDEILDSIHDEISKRNIQIETKKLPDCEVDPILLRQIYFNLIANSIKFTRKQNAPLIEIGYLDHYQNQASHPDKSGISCYYVKDNGVGFDMKYYDKLFGVFQRLHRAEDYEGTGVGLAIVERIIKKHDGQIWAESSIGEGATFYFTLGDKKDGT